MIKSIARRVSLTFVPLEDRRAPVLLPVLPIVCILPPISVAAQQQSLHANTWAGKAARVTSNDEIQLKTGDAMITMKKDGTVTIKGQDIIVQGGATITIKQGLFAPSPK